MFFGSFFFFSYGFFLLLIKSLKFVRKSLKRRRSGSKFRLINQRGEEIYIVGGDESAKDTIYFMVQSLFYVRSPIKSDYNLIFD